MGVQPGVHGGGTARSPRWCWPGVLGGVGQRGPWWASPRLSPQRFARSVESCSLRPSVRSREETAFHPDLT